MQEANAPLYFNFATDIVDRWAARLQPGARSYARSWIRDGALMSGPQWIAGAVGDALAFAGGSYVSVNDVSQVDDVRAVTLAAWIRRSVVGGPKYSRPLKISLHAGPCTFI